MWQSPLRKLRCFVIFGIQVNTDDCLIVKLANILSSGSQRNNKTITRSQKPVKTHKQNILSKTKGQSTLSDDVIKGKILEMSGCSWLDRKLRLAYFCELTNLLLLLCNSTTEGQIWVQNHISLMMKELIITFNLWMRMSNGSLGTQRSMMSHSKRYVPETSKHKNKQRLLWKSL